MDAVKQSEERVHHVSQRMSKIVVKLAPVDSLIKRELNALNLHFVTRSERKREKLDLKLKLLANGG